MGGWSGLIWWGEGGIFFSLAMIRDGWMDGWMDVEKVNYS